MSASRPATPLCDRLRAAGEARLASDGPLPAADVAGPGLLTGLGVARPMTLARRAGPYTEEHTEDRLTGRLTPCGN